MVGELDIKKVIELRNTLIGHIVGLSYTLLTVVMIVVLSKYIVNLIQLYSKL